jgi:hypothetical protein
MPAKISHAPAKVVYFMQTHSRPAQLARLVKVITEGSPDAVVLVSHDAAGSPLDVAALESLGNVRVTLEQGGYGDFSHLDRYLAAVDWLDANGIEYDWLQNLSGQDYPLRPIAEIEADLAAAGTDGYLLYSPVFPDRIPDDADRGAAGYRLAPPFDAEMRYDYSHWRLGRVTPVKERLLYPLMALNLMQPCVRVSSAYAAFGVRRRDTVFDSGFVCYGGSFFCTLRAECARYVRDYAKRHPDVVDFFRTVLAPEESFLHSILVNSGQFSLVPQGKHYIDWTGVRNTHPRTLGAEDAGKMLASDAHWARKLDLNKDSRLFDLLDQRVRREPGELGGPAFTRVYAAR